MKRPYRRSAQPVGDLLGPALRELGMPSKRLTGRVLRAWEQVAEPGWRNKARPDRLVGGVLVVQVTSASLRDELAQYHRARLLEVLKTALPDVPLVGIRFTMAEHGAGSTGDSR
jgi:hypothetical protein